MVMGAVPFTVSALTRTGMTAPVLSEKGMWPRTVESSKYVRHCAVDWGWGEDGMLGR